jgi:hydroxymethylglutaryl-CoA reductase (NADPH)
MIEQIEHPDFFQRLNQAVRETSRYATLQEINCHLIGRQLFIRIHIHPGDASGHNMSTKAAENILKLLQSTYPELQYVSLSGNACSDKKVSAINSLLGRGKSMIAELVIPRAILQQLARTTPEKMVDINLKKNLLGSHVAGSVRSANAHVANTLLAFYLATGQDAANIVEGSQAITTCDLTQSGDLYFAVTLPNLIIGTVGNGKHLPAVQLELSKLPFPKSESPGHQSRQLAALCAASVLCSELSLLSALTNPEELMRAHILLERASSKENRQ